MTSNYVFYLVVELISLPVRAATNEKKEISSLHTLHGFHIHP